ncbi:MAG: TfoX/Sxy family protein [Hyphomicrobiales bacterium]|nr:TfoX/Sxy family protein [Hyphomicrobiales bacterium]
MALDSDYLTWLEDLFSVVPDTNIKSMFGGAGVFRQGLMFGLATSDGRISLKADDETLGDFIAEGCEEWQYQRKNGKITTMGYWYMPERLSEDTEELLAWSLKAFEVAMRADRNKPPGQRKLK